MSNYLAIATVTATLRHLIQSVIQVDVAGARVTTVRPDTSGSGTPDVGVNIFLYQAVPSLAWRNSDLRPRRPKGELTKQAQAGIDLYYLFSFHGNEVELEPQRLLGSTIRTLVDQPILTPELIRETMNNSTLDFLSRSDLADQIERVTFTPVSMNTDDLSKIWSVFLQTPYVLSFAYQGSTVLLEGDKPGQGGLPLRSSQFYITPNQPVIEQVTSDTGDLRGFLASSTVVIRGRQLNAEVSDDRAASLQTGNPIVRGQPQVKIGDVQVEVEPISDREIRLELATLPAAQRNQLRAGIQSLQVVYLLLPQRSPNEPDRLIASNSIPFVLSATIVQSELLRRRDEGDSLRSGEISVRLDLLVSPQQRVVLLLNELLLNNPASYVFTATSRTEDSNLVTVPIGKVKAGRYLVRVQIDGVESRLQVDSRQNSPTFDQYVSPAIDIL
ncbi:MAG: DUF4255 domain-containing protein [Leptolyngbyaceae cyanobacterium CSU_1_3]|nr:DUF4255 domain-containing protein [Leptolyngbyaceae cyanobacterium CSU_1_3]